MAEENVKFGWQKVKGHGPLVYFPSPEEIRVQCRQIQSQWSDRDRLQRSLWDVIDYEKAYSEA
jgi:hypothetical protein